MINTIKIFFNKIWYFVKPVLIELIKIVRKYDWSVGVSLCESYLDKDIDVDEKRKIIFGELKDYLAAMGLEVSSSWINLIIELSYQWVRLKTLKNSERR